MARALCEGVKANWSRSINLIINNLPYRKGHISSLLMHIHFSVEFHRDMHSIVATLYLTL